MNSLNFTTFARLLVLSSESRHLPVTFSLTTPAPQPTAGESAIRDLLRLVRNPRPKADLRNQKFKNNPGFQTRTPTFLSGGLPRDRRGRVALKGKNPPELTGLRGLGLGTEDETFGEETPRIGPGSYAIDMERVEREREFLEALRFVFCIHHKTIRLPVVLEYRSPEIEPTGARASLGGWGLGAGNVENSKASEEEEEEDEPLDWDQAQVCFKLKFHPFDN
jgi:hypothetical protein